jgi:hypothetical protein
MPVPPEKVIRHMAIRTNVQEEKKNLGRIAALE